MPKIVIGVMGPGDNPSPLDIEYAEQLGALIAKEHWILLTGGRNRGVMEAAMKGARGNNGTTVGILPDEHKERMSEYTEIPVITGMGSARNAINVLSSDVVVAVGFGPGTMSEIMLALKAGKPIVALNQTAKATAFLEELNNNNIHFPETPEEAHSIIGNIIRNSG